jgi:hypothetical protein
MSTFSNARKSLNQVERLSYANERANSKILLATPFVLQKDTSNRHKVDSALEKTVKVLNQIPFLREVRDTSN